MRQLKIVLVILLVLTIGASAVSYIYRHRTLDSTAPVLTSDREVLELSVESEQEALFDGLSAVDNRDGDLTDRIMIDHFSHLIESGTVRVTYVVFDDSDNFAKLTRTLHYSDYVSPHFELTQPLVFSVGQPVYIGQRLKAVDCLDGDISSEIQISTQDLNLNQSGLYTINVQATNSLGDTVVLPLQVLMVQGNSLPEITLTENLVYIEAGTRFYPGDYIQKVTDPALEENDQTLSKYMVKTIGAVDTKTPGVYYVQFYCYGVNGTGYSMLTVVVQ